MARKAKKSERIVRIEWTGEEMKGGGAVHIKPGEYLLKVQSVEHTTSKSDNPMLKWVFEGLEGKAKGKSFYYYTVLTEESLWNLASLLKNLGVDVPEKPEDLDLDELIDLEVMATIDDEEYQNKTRSKIVDFSESDGDSGDKAEDEKPSKKGGKKGGKKDKDLPPLSADEVKGMDADELSDVNDKYELGVELDEFKTPRRKAAAILAALEEKELIEE